MVELRNLGNAIVGSPNGGGSTLSVEQRKRLTIAVEVVANPAVIFMDEPTSGQSVCFRSSPPYHTVADKARHAAAGQDKTRPPPQCQGLMTHAAGRCLRISGLAGVAAQGFGACWVHHASDCQGCIDALQRCQHLAARAIVRASREAMDKCCDPARGHSCPVH